MTSLDTGSLPTTWKVGRIGDLFESWGGHTPSKSNPRYWGGDVPWVSSKDVKAARLLSSTYSVTQKAVDETGLKLSPKGTVLVVVRSGVLAHTLPVTITEVQVTINQDLKAFHSAAPLMNEWLALFLRMSAHALLASSRRDGTTVQSIQYPLLKDTVIPVPPLEDRRWIIDAVGMVLAKQSSTPPHLAAARRAIERFRRAVLAAACSGRLTFDWRASNMTDELSAQDPDQPPGWRWTTFGQACDRVTVGHVGKMVNEYRPSGVPFLRSLNVRELRFEPEDLKFISHEFHQRLAKSALRPGDIVVVRSGYVGTACVIPPELEEVITSVSK